MSEKRNISNLSKEAQALCSGIGDRAIWFHLLLQAAENQNVDLEKLTDESIFVFGKNLFKDKKADNAREFVEHMAAPGIGKEAFAQEIVESRDEYAVAHFHACPLVEAWKDYGLSAERIKDLCRFACKGDFGRASNFKNFEIEFPKTIGNGDEYCELIAKNK
ncbi:MAG: L-2-amino-thiazoline-4-carboxylic acid hydrolase [Anaerotignaceae bacterium]